MKRFILVFSLVGLLLAAPAARGQVFFVATVDQSQEPSPTGSQGQGTAWAILASDLSTLTYRVTYANLDSTFTAAHFHVGAPGVSGPVVFPLTFEGTTTSGTWSSVPDSIVRALLQGRLYVNIHSRARPAGEIRGQFNRVSGAGFSISLSGDQENPAVATGSSGTGWAWLDTTGHIRYRATIAGLSDTLTAAHFHSAAPGTSGPVIHPVSFADSTTQDTAATFADSLLVKMLKGGVYLNVHSKAHPGGEIRGQLVQANGIRLVAWLDGLQENPPNSSEATGSAWGKLSQDMSSLTYRATYAQLESTFTASHYHLAPTGGVVHPVTFTGNTAEGIWNNIADTLLLALIKGNLYLNIHSRDFPGGEIRGFLKVAQGLGFTIGLDGSQENPATGTGAMGTGWAVLDSSAARLTYRATVAGLSDEMRAAHFHSGAAGVSGPVVHPVSFDDSTTQGTWTGFPDSILTRLLNGEIYLNVHSATHPGGEIRGSLLIREPLSTDVEPVAGRGIPASFRLEQNYPNPFNPSTAIEFQLARAAHVSLRVFNLLGQEVATLVNDARQAGVYRVTFDASALASGVYFYRLATDNGVIASKKMMLLK